MTAGESTGPNNHRRDAPHCKGHYMNAVVQIKEPGLASAETSRFSAVEIRERVNLVQSVMQGVMKRDTHYGTIPGTPKPTLYKPGAEVLCVTFRVAQKYQIEDLSTETVSRYRVTCDGVHQTTGLFLGSGVGECSSGEEKYKWRGAVNAQEFEATPENLRRLKFYKNGGKATQVRTEAADLANTILKMACKRAMVAMTLNVTAASDIFTQDIEDLPEELRAYESEPAQPKGLPQYPQADFEKNLPAWRKLIESGKQTAQSIIAKVETKALLTEEQKAVLLSIKKLEVVGRAAPEQIEKIRTWAADMAVPEAEICKHVAAESIDTMTPEQAEKAIAFLNGDQ
jgi:hypothetical protein